VDDSLTEREVIACEENVAEEDSEGSEDSKPQETKDVTPDGGAFFSGEGVTDLRQGSPNGCIFKGLQPLVRMCLFFCGKGDSI